jgi:hypothetical protein
LLADVSDDPGSWATASALVYLGREATGASRKSKALRIFLCSGRWALLLHVVASAGDRKTKRMFVPRRGTPRIEE